ncbi:hypothetical protein [Burkholderia ubonensis]|uniref:hypothetical protein n=1 Tax=Burkholderia ubonensis TaxID=101571 RepID=UPI0012BAC409|nr:hypothetical protein [Burkholderia ubonensis]
MARYFKAAKLPLLMLVVLLAVFFLKECISHDEYMESPEKQIVPAASMASVFRQEAGLLPADCETYLRRIEVCANDAGLQAATVIRLREVIVVARREWIGVSNRDDLLVVCRQLLGDFSRSASEAGCH